MLIPAALASGCGGSSSAADAKATSSDPFQGVTPTTNTQELGIKQPDPGEPKSGGTLTVAWAQEPPSIAGNSIWVQNGYLNQQYLEQLVSAAPGNKVVPWLATSWKESNGGKTYTFKIKQGVKFHDGTPLDAQAVADNFYAWLDPDPATFNSYVAAYIGDVFKSAKALDEYTLQVDLKEPYVYFLDGISQYAFGIQSPKQLKQPASVQSEHPVGTGAFKVVKWNHGENVILERNEQWTSQPANLRHEGLAYVDKIIWRFIPDNNTRWAAFKSGAAQLIYDIPGVNWQEAKSQYAVSRHTTAGTPFRFFLAAKWGPLKDVRLRQAVSYAFDDRGAVQAAYHGARIPNKNGALSPANETYDKSLDTAFAYDPAKANALLDEAGWTERNADGYRTKNGKELKLKLVYGTAKNAAQDDVQLFQILQANEKEVGIHVELVPVAPSQFWTSKQTAGPNWDLQPWYWVGRSPETLHVVWNDKIGGVPNFFNATGYFDPRVGPLIKKLDQSPELADQTKYSQQIQNILVRDKTLVLGISGMQVTLASSPKLHGVWQSADVGEPVLSDAWLSQ
ncbi:MAG: ABC transporter substrate-binding protein [Patulibacter sp.]